MSEQKISCEGCSSKWAVISVGNQILELVECPLCSEEKLECVCRGDKVCPEIIWRPRNWATLGIKIGNVRGVRTNKSVIVPPGRCGVLMLMSY